MRGLEGRDYTRRRVRVGPIRVGERAVVLAEGGVVVGEEGADDSMLMK